MPRKHTMNKRHTPRSRLILFLIVISLLILGGCFRKASDTSPEITDVSISPLVLSVGEESKVTVSAQDDVGISKIEINVDGYLFRFYCGNQKKCTKELARTIPETVEGKTLIIVFVVDSSEQQTSKTMEVQVLPRKEQSAACGNQRCEPGETVSSCPIDCNKQVPPPTVCGNEVCENREDYRNCPDDCDPPLPVCGNAVCENGENAQNCSLDCQSQGGDSHPSDLFDMQAIRNPSTLNLKILVDETYTNQELGKQVRHMKMTFFSNTWFSVDIYGSADLYIPVPLPAENKGNGAIIQDHSEALDPGMNMQYDFGEKTALRFGLPVMVCNCSVPANDFGFPGETELSRSFREEMFQDNDMSKEIAYPLVYIYMRAMTAFNTRSEAGNPTRFVIGGSSKRGLTQWVVAAVDDRVKGFMSSAFNSGNLVNFWNLVDQDWGGTSYIAISDAKTVLAWLDTENGKKYRQLYDPYEFRESIAVPFVMNVGTQDHLYPLESANAFFPALNNPKAFALIDNYPHGMGSMKHVINWRATIHRTFLGRKTPDIRVTSQDLGTQMEVTAAVSNNELVHYVTLFYTTNPTMDFRTSVFKSVTMQESDGTYTATIDKPPSGNKLAYYVELKDAKDQAPSYTTSMVTIV